ncbi:MAG: GNAT family N-acetyltransferase [Pseudomonadota bacterium]|nr:GNAT family N-acetyltransferase [Pseudomonadota bacterium]
MALPAAFDTALLSRIEDASINASAPPQQRWLDGWLVRYSSGKAKRARCINAVGPGRQPIAEKLALCQRIYDEASLRLYFRITPFSQPADLDGTLEAMGLIREDDTRVMVSTTLPELSGFVQPSGHRLKHLGPDAFAGLVGEMRGSPLAEREAQAQRLALSPVPCQGFAMVDEAGAPAACGQVAIEAEFVGLYDVFTAAPHHGRGLATALCRQMLLFAQQRGARVAYLQVDPANEIARHLYRGLAFSDAYTYHYRARRTA